MIKKTTLIVLLCAVALGGVVYYLDWKRAAKDQEGFPEEKTKPAFSLQSSDISNLSLTRPAGSGEPAIEIVKRNNEWQISKPIETGADQPSVAGIADGIATARIAQTMPGTPDRLKVYGLDPPQVRIDFQLQNGTKHTLRLGSKDFTGASVYSIVDDAKDVALLPKSLLVSADKPLSELRDHAVLHIVSGQQTSFILKNPSGELRLTKEKSSWKFAKPAGALADASDVDSFLNAISIARIAAVVSEKPDNPGKFGLERPAITLTVVDDKGIRSTLVVGKKDGDDYFARDTSRQTIFRINEELYKKLTKNFNDLRDKNLLHLDAAEVSRVEIKNVSGTVVLTRKKEDGWMIESPDEQKGKSVAEWKFLTPIIQARASEVLDHPAPDVVVMLAKPAIEATLTTKDGKKLTVRISKDSGDFVYARTSNAPAVFKLNKETLNTLNFKAADLVS